MSNVPNPNRSFRLEKSHVIISIIAAACITAGFIFRILTGMPTGLFYMALWVSLGIFVFYCVGTFVRVALINQVFEYSDGALEDAVGIENTDNTPDYMEESPIGMMDDSYDDVMFEETMLEPEMYD